MEWLEVQCSQLFHECHAGKPIDGEPLRGSVGGPIMHDKLFFFSDVSGFGLHCPLSRPPSRPPPSRLRPFKITSCSDSPWVDGFRYGVSLSAIPAVGAVLSEDIFALRKYQRPHGTWLSVRCRWSCARNSLEDSGMANWGQTDPRRERNYVSCQLVATCLAEFDVILSLQWGGA
jgi:hypothetical protein